MVFGTENIAMWIVTIWCFGTEDIAMYVDSHHMVFGTENIAMYVDSQCIRSLVRRILLSM